MAVIHHTSVVSTLCATFDSTLNAILTIELSRYITHRNDALLENNLLYLDVYQKASVHGSHLLVGGWVNMHSYLAIQQIITWQFYHFHVWESFSHLYNLRQSSPINKY